MKLFDFKCPVERCVWTFWAIVLVVWLAAARIESKVEANQEPNDDYVALYPDPDFTREQRDALRKRHREINERNTKKLNQRIFEDAMRDRGTLGE